MLTLIDSGMGNIGSVKNMLNKIGTDLCIATHPDEVKSATKLILPGVGSFDNGIQRLKQKNLFDSIRSKALDEKIPLLGICLGMQLLASNSEEGNEEGLNLIPGQVKKFKFDNSDTTLKIPHMGWNRVYPKQYGSLFTNPEEALKFYFVHSFHYVPDTPKDILTTTEHGGTFVSAVQKDNIIGVQFHPEKSHKFGVQLFKNFVAL